MTFKKVKAPGLGSKLKRKLLGSKVNRGGSKGSEYGAGNAAADYLMDHVGGFKPTKSGAKRVKVNK
jgi:hypothetical protein